jgi:GT2 family glycosyltransferase
MSNDPTSQINLKNPGDGISVIVATHGRLRLVEKLLQSLYVEKQKLKANSEVLIIDSSPQSIADPMSSVCSKYEAIYVPYECNNVREKRNLGIKKAQYAILLFIDSDCIAMEHLLEEHLKAYATNDNSIGGVIGLTRFAGSDTWIWKVITHTSLLDAFSYAERFDTVPWGPTCNISYRKDVIEKTGYFDTGFPFRLGGDDTDLGLRVNDAGYVIRSNPGAVVEHTRETWSRIDLIGKRVFRWGRMHFHMMRKYKKRVFYDFPKITGLFIFLLLLITPLAIYNADLCYFSVPFIWLAINILLETILLCVILGNSFWESGHIFFARLFSLLFELGTFVEALKNGSLLPFYKEANYTPPSLNGRNRRIIQIWGSTMSLIILLILRLF